MTVTLRTLSGLDQKPGSLEGSTLLMVDFQNTYTKGILELDGWQPALKAAADLLTAAREAGAAVIHIVHNAGPGSPFDVTADIGAIHSSVAPNEGEPIVVKTMPNSFVKTDLADHVEQAGNKSLIIAGFMTNMCVTFTAEGAFLRGHHVTVVADACATRPLETSVSKVSAPDLHNGALATISDLYGVVVSDRTSLG